MEYTPTRQAIASAAQKAQDAYAKYRAVEEKCRHLEARIAAMEATLDDAMAHVDARIEALMRPVAVEPVKQTRRKAA
jgi:hypothetical protein